MAKVISPGIEAISASQMVRPLELCGSRLPARSESAWSSNASGSADISMACGKRALTAVATPATRPPPETGATTMSGDDAKRRHVFGDLLAHRALARDHQRIVVRRHQRRAALAGDVAGDRFTVLAVAVVQHHLGAVGLGALALGERRIGRHHDGRPAC